MKKIMRLAVCFGVFSLFTIGVANAVRVQSTLREYNEVRIQNHVAPIAGDPNTPLICDVQPNQRGGSNIDCRVIRQPQPQQQHGYPNPDNQQVNPYGEYRIGHILDGIISPEDQLRYDAQRDMINQQQDDLDQSNQEADTQRQLDKIDRMFR